LIIGKGRVRRPIRWKDDGMPVEQPAGPGADVGVPAEALRVAHDAAERAGLAVRRLSEPSELRALADVVGKVWGAAAEPLLSQELLRVLAFDTGYLAGAFPAGGSGPKDLLGVCVGLIGLTQEHTPLLHSHITGVLPEGRRRHAGHVLKLHQRSWALSVQLSLVQWTTDPLVRRNAYFNTVKLAALPVTYLPDFYGEMTDRLNAGQHSDRLLIRWDLASDVVRAAASGTPWVPAVPPGAIPVLAEDADGRPMSRPLPDATTAVLVGTPADVERLRMEYPRLARDWRAAQREVLPGLLSGGWRITGVVGRSSYLLESGEVG
jgi:predicted GNAT superfamily acetyltransferase